MAYDTACIAVGTVLMWKNEIEDLYDRGWLHPAATFDHTDYREMSH